MVELLQKGWNAIALWRSVVEVSFGVIRDYLRLLKMSSLEKAARIHVLAPVLRAFSSMRFFRDGVLFIHVPKNAGTSVSRVLYGGPLTHHTALYYQDLLGEKLGEILSFAVLRDPIDRCISAYFFVVNGGTTDIRLNEYWKYRTRKIRSFNDYVAFLENNYHRIDSLDPVMQTQSHYVLDRRGVPIPQKLFVLGYDDAALQDFLTDLGCSSIPRINVTARTDISPTKDQLDLILRIYSRDVELVQQTLARKVVPHRNEAAQFGAVPRRVRHLNYTRRQARWLPAGAMAAAALAAIVVFSWPTPRTEPTTFSTAKGERRSFVLADGTRLDLNAASRVSVQLNTKLRRVDLVDGEAAFKVIHDSARPFVVATKGRLVTDVGTEFDVRQRGRDFSVTVAQGIVDVQTTGETRRPPIRLIHGQRLSSSPIGEGLTVQNVLPEDEFAWQSGRLVLRDKSLAAVVAELNLYFAKPIRVTDPQLAERRVSGVLVVNKEDGALRYLSSIAPMTIALRHGEYFLEPSAPRSPNP